MSPSPSYRRPFLSIVFLSPFSTTDNRRHFFPGRLTRPSLPPLPQILCCAPLCAREFERSSCWPLPCSRCGAFPFLHRTDGFPRYCPCVIADVFPAPARPSPLLPTRVRGLLAARCSSSPTHLCTQTPVRAYTAIVFFLEWKGAGCGRGRT